MFIWLNEFRSSVPRNPEHNLDNCRIFPFNVQRIFSETSRFQIKVSDCIKQFLFLPPEILPKQEQVNFFSGIFHDKEEDKQERK